MGGPGLSPSVQVGAYLFGPVSGLDVGGGAFSPFIRCPPLLSDVVVATVTPVSSGRLGLGFLPV